LVRQFQSSPPPRNPARAPPLPEPQATHLTATPRSPQRSQLARFDMLK
jgi:hypothetical protein